MSALDAVFGTDDRLLWWQECARALLIFAYGLAAIRLAGRRTFGRWAALDIVMSIVVGSSLSRALTGGAALFGTLAATSALVLVHWVLAAVAARWEPASHLLEGRPVLLAAEGVLRRGTVLRHAVTHADIGEALRGSGLARVEDARLVTLEPSGRITAVKGQAPPGASAPEHGRGARP